MENRTKGLEHMRLLRLQFWTYEWMMERKNGAPSWKKGILCSDVPGLRTFGRSDAESCFGGVGNAYEQTS